jgi:hypothetical protein
MKPVYREPFYKQIAFAEKPSVDEVVDSGKEFKKQSILERTNNLLRNLDINFDSLVIALTAWSLIITFVTSYTTIEFFPLIMFCLLLIVVFLGALQMRTIQDKSILNECSKELPVEQNYDIVTSNLSILKSKYVWMCIIVGFVFFISAYCGMSIMSERHFILITSAIILSSISSFFIFSRKLHTLNDLASKFDADYSTINS